MTTKAIWPWVSTAALERPVVPEVKKNQQGSSYSTAALATLRAAMRGDRPRSTSALAERGRLRRCRQMKSTPGARLRDRRGMVGKIAVAQERLRAGGLAR